MTRIVVCLIDLQITEHHGSNVFKQLYSVRYVHVLCNCKLLFTTAVYGSCNIGATTFQNADDSISRLRVYIRPV